LALFVGASLMNFIDWYIICTCDDHKHQLPVHLRSRS